MRSPIGSDALTRLLLVESDPSDRQAMLDDLKMAMNPDTSIEAVGTGRDAIALLREGSFDVILADIQSLGDLCGDAEAAMSKLARTAGGSLIVALSTAGSVSSAVAAMRAGAHDYIPKPVSGKAFAARVEELAQRHGKASAMPLCTGKHGARDFEGFVGVSHQMQVVYEQIQRVATSMAPVFITGESGTGKQVCAEALHRRGPRAEKPLIAVNCGAIMRDLMEAELFGVARGMFTGAVEDRPGAIELADGGTLFLDEIGGMDLGLQAKLLRFLQTGSISRVGDSTPRQVDVRVVCATKRNPMQLIVDRTFREDLFYRLHVLPIHLPPLRQRPADILPLAHAFLDRFAKEEHKSFSGISPETADFLIAREWPGNVRQLQNLIRRVVVMFEGGEVQPHMVTAADIENHAAIARPIPSPRSGTATEILPMWRQEQQIIEDAIAHFGGNIAQAAAALEISPSTIYRKKQIWEQAAPQVAGAA